MYIFVATTEFYTHALLCYYVSVINTYKNKKCFNSLRCRALASHVLRNGQTDSDGTDIYSNLETPQSPRTST